MHGMYPGSTTIALDVAASLGTTLRVCAWDTSTGAAENLTKSLGFDHVVHREAAQPSEPDVLSADFLFIDPPNRSEWRRISQFLDVSRADVLIWLPLHTSGKGEVAKDADIPMSLAGRLTPPYHATRVRWAPVPAANRRPIGCDLIYRFRQQTEAASALRESVDAVATLMGWRLPTHS